LFRNRAGRVAASFSSKEQAMQHPQVDECVRLRQSIPELHLAGGAVGVVCSTWFAPHTAYEVEFRRPGVPDPLRVLLLEQQLELAAAGATATSGAEA
jgi:hypothetical protein